MFPWGSVRGAVAKPLSSASWAAPPPRRAARAPHPAPRPRMWMPVPAPVAQPAGLQLKTARLSLCWCLVLACVRDERYFETLTKSASRCAGAWSWSACLMHAAPSRTAPSAGSRSSSSLVLASAAWLRRASRSAAPRAATRLYSRKL